MAQALLVGSPIFTTLSPTAERSQVEQAASEAMEVLGGKAARAVPEASAAQAVAEAMGRMPPRPAAPVEMAATEARAATAVSVALADWAAKGDWAA